MALQRSTGIGSRWDFQLGSKSDQVKVADPLGYERNVSDDPTAVVRFCRPRASRAVQPPPLTSLSPPLPCARCTVALHPPALSLSCVRTCRPCPSTCRSRPQVGSGDAVKDEENFLKLTNQRVMAIAWSPGKQIFMTGLMLYMSGGGLHIFSIMMTAMAMRTPITSLMNTNATFKQFEGEKVDLMMPKIIFICCSLAGLAMGLYKLSTMGLLPVTAADWFQLIEAKQVVEASAAAIPVGQ